MLSVDCSDFEKVCLLRGREKEVTKGEAEVSRGLGWLLSHLEAGKREHVCVQRKGPSKSEWLVIQDKAQGLALCEAKCFLSK